jgi:putative ATP-dependent endonuclease of OLD family
MYLSELKIWNYRKYGSLDFNIEKPNLIVPFNSGLNVLIGENDSGKTAIIDAIKLVLKTHAYEWIKVELNDFYKLAGQFSDKIRIELTIKGLEPNEAKNFIEWLGWEGNGETAKPLLKLIFQIQQKDGKVLPADVKAGMDEDGHPLNAEAREYLKATYLKALRDAENELIAKKNSRLSQILHEHKLLNPKKNEDKHHLVKEFDIFNETLKKWFNEGDGKVEIKDKIDEILKLFIDKDKISEFTAGGSEIKNILEKLTLNIEQANNLGLGTLNRLFMAAELLHLKKDNWDGLRLCLIEELEAHLHPQVQLKVIDYIQNQSLKSGENKVQFILTTHSPNLASKVNLKNLILCKDNDAYPLGDADCLEESSPDKYTVLEKSNYTFLKRFLEVTKSNLFFAKGVILVEGWSEELLIPALASKIGCDLVENEVSVVNVGSTAYLHYAKIFQRNDKKVLNIPVSVVTDLDVKTDANGITDKEREKKKKENIESIKGQSVCTFIAQEWTLEWCLFKSKLSTEFQDIVKSVHSGTKAAFDADFEKTLRDKLIGKERSKLNKTEIAGRMAEKIEKLAKINEEDEYLKYLIDAIKYACRKTKCKEVN